MKSCWFAAYKERQNAAESLNSKIWLLCPTTKFASRTAVETAAAIAVLWFNKGHSSIEHILQELGVLPPDELITEGQSPDRSRIQRMSACKTAEAKAHRHRMVNRVYLDNSNYGRRRQIAAVCKQWQNLSREGHQKNEGRPPVRKLVKFSGEAKEFHSFCIPYSTRKASQSDSCV